MLVRLVLQEVVTPIKGCWKCIAMGNGVLYVMISSDLKRQLLLAGNWDIIITTDMISCQCESMSLRKQS